MGNTYSYTSEDIQWTMVGRSNDIQKLTSLIEKSRQVNITGLKKVGKSRVMVELAKRMNADDKGRYFVLFVDFENVYVQDHSALYELILDAIKVLETKTRKEFNGNDFGIAENDPDSKPDELLKVSIQRLITSITRFSKEVQQVALFLDNVEKVMDSDKKDIFLDFVSQIIKQSTGTKCVLASSIKPSSIKKNVNQYELEKLTTQEIIELLFEITENRDGIYQRSETYTETDGRQYWFSFSNEMEIFKPENQIYINIIAKLCEGLPLAAEVSGTLLTEDDCLLEPSELVEILIMGRLSSLSPENCPPDERLDQYKDQMAQMGFKEFFDNLNENIQGCEFGIVEATEAVGDDQATTAVVKKDYIKKAMQKCVLSANKMSKEKKWIWHSVLREGQGLLQLVELLPESEQAKEIVFRFIENNIKTAELDFTEDVLKDRKSLEQAILSLRYTALTEKKVICTEDDSKQSKEIEIEEPNSLTLEQTSDEKRAIRYTRSTQERSEEINLRFQNLTFGINTEQGTLSNKSSDERPIENQFNRYMHLNNPTSESEMLSTQTPNIFTDINTSEYLSTYGQFLQPLRVSSVTPKFSETPTLQAPVASTPQQALCTPHPFTNTPQLVFPPEQSPTDNPVTSPRKTSSHRLHFLLEPLQDNPPPYTPQSPSNTGNEALGAPPPYSTHQQGTINKQTLMTPHDQPTNIQLPQMPHFQNTQQPQMTTHQQRTINEQTHMTLHERPPNIQSPQMQHFQNTQQHQMTTHQQRTRNQQSHMTPNEHPPNIQSPQMQHFQNTQQHQMTMHTQRTINQQSHMTLHERPPNIQSPQLQHFQSTQQHRMTTHEERTINQQSHMTPHEQPPIIQSPQMPNFQNTEQRQMTTHQQRTINQQSHITPHEQPTYIQSPQMNTQQHQMTTHQQRTINQQFHMTPHDQPPNFPSPHMQHFQNTQQHQMTTYQQRTINQQSHMSPHEQSANIQSPKMQLYYNFQNTQQSHHNIPNRQLVQMTPQQDWPNPQSAYMTTHHNFSNNPTSPLTHNQHMHIPISEDFQVLQPSCDDSMLMRQRKLSNSSQSVVSQMGLCPNVCFADTETSLSTLHEQSHVSSSFIPPMESVQHNPYENGKPSNTIQYHYNLPLQSQVIHHANVLPERFTTRQQNANDLNRKQSTYLVDPNPRHMSKNLEQFLPMQSIQQNPIENITVSANTPNHQQNLPSQTQQYFSTGTSSDQLTNRQQYANDLPRSRDTHPNKNASHMSENFSATGSPAMQYIPPSWPTSLQQPNYLNTVHTHDSRFQQYSAPVQTISDMKSDINDKQRLQEFNPKPTYPPEPPGCLPQLSTSSCWNSKYGPQDISYTTASYVGVSSQPQSHQNQFVVSHLPHGQQNSQSQSEYREGHIQQTGQHNLYHQYFNQQSEQLNVIQSPASQPNGPHTVPHNFTVSYCTANNYNTEALTSKQYKKQEVVQTQVSDTDDKTTNLMKSVL